MKPVLQLDDVTFRRDSKQIIDGISLTVNEGEHWALLGPNGAGKSTLLGFCGAVTFPSSGSVRVLGERMGRTDPRCAAAARSATSTRATGLQQPRTVREVVLTGITGTNDLPLRWTPTTEEVERADAMIDTVGLSRRSDGVWPTLSQGERGRTLIARALISGPRLLLLDEPSTGLDVAAREQLLQTIDSLGEAHPDVASILVTHHLEELPSTTTHALLIAEGRTVASGTAVQTVNTDNVTAAFSHPVQVGHHDGRWTARAKAIRMEV